MRTLFIPLLLAAAGCQTPAVQRQADAGPGEKPAVALPAAAEVIPCAAAVPAGDAQPPPVLPPPRKVPDPPDPTTPVTLADLEKLALASNPTLPAAAALVQQQQGLTRQAGLYPNPVAGYVRTDPDQPGQSETQGVFLSQELVTAGKLRLARAAGSQEVEHRNWQVSAQQMRVLNDVRIRFYEVLGAQQAVTLATELEKLAEEGVRAARRLLEARQGSRPDLLQAEIQLNAVRTALQDARFRHQAAWRQLANVVGIPNLHPAPLLGRLEDDIPALDWEKSLQQLFASSPLLRAQEAEIRASELEVRLARAQAVPNVSVQMVAQRDHIEKFSSVSTLIALPVPLFNRNQGNILNAEGVLRQQQKEYERIKLALGDQLAASFRQYLTLRNQAEQLRKEILPRAKENLELTTEGYRLKRFDFPRLLAARQTYFQTNQAYLDALTELHKVVVEIEGLQLTGGLNPTEVGTALQTTPGAGGAGVRGVLLQQLQEQRTGLGRTLPGAVQAGER